MVCRNDDIATFVTNINNNNNVLQHNIIVIHVLYHKQFITIVTIG